MADFAGGVAGRRSPPPGVAIGIEAVGFVAVPLAILILPTRVDISAVVFAFAGGAVGGLGLIAFYRAMAMNLIGVVSPITAVVAAALPVGVGVLSGERLHSGQLAGIALGLVAIVLLNAGGRTAGDGARQSMLRWACLNSRSKPPPIMLRQRRQLRKTLNVEANSANPCERPVRSCSKTFLPCASGMNGC